MSRTRCLLLSGRDVTGAALEVGYESSTQFIYKRLFDEPPERDDKTIQAVDRDYAAM